MFMFLYKLALLFFFFIKDDKSYFIFLESLLTVSSTPHSSNHFLKLEDTLNKTRLFNAVSSIKKSIISSMHFSSFIFKKRKGKKKGKSFFFSSINDYQVIFFFINFLISSIFFKILHHLNMVNMVTKQYFQNIASYSWVIHGTVWG